MHSDLRSRSSLRGNAGTVDITPAAATRLAGFAIRRQAPSEGVGQRLQASVLVLRDERGSSQAIISLDLLFVGPDLTRRLRTFAARELGIQRRDLLIAASHTHSAPPVDANKPNLGHVERDYVEYVGQRCCELLRSVAQGPMQPIYFRTGRTQWDGAVYRRRRWWLPHLSKRRLAIGKILMAPNRREPIDGTVRLLELIGEDDAPIAFVWSAACHPSGWPDYLELSSDYIGVVRDRLAPHLGDETPVVFLQGFTGDLRPEVPERRPLRRRVHQIVKYGPSFDRFSPADWAIWVDKLAALVIAALNDLRRGQAMAPTGSLGGAIIEIPLAAVIDSSEAGTRPVEFQQLRAGSMYSILCLSCEPCSMLLPVLDDPAVWPVGYGGDVFGYWPTDRQRREGGYEGRDWMAAFDLPGTMRPGLDRLFAESVRGLSEEWGGRPGTAVPDEKASDVSETPTDTV